MLLSALVLLSWLGGDGGGGGSGRRRSTALAQNTDSDGCFYWEVSGNWWAEWNMKDIDICHKSHDKGRCVFNAKYTSNCMQLDRWMDCLCQYRLWEHVCQFADIPNLDTCRKLAVISPCINYISGPEVTQMGECDFDKMFDEGHAVAWGWFHGHSGRRIEKALEHLMEIQSEGCSDEAKKVLKDRDMFKRAFKLLQDKFGSLKTEHASRWGQLCGGDDPNNQEVTTLEPYSEAPDPNGNVGETFPNTDGNNNNNNNGNRGGNNTSGRNVPFWGPPVSVGGFTLWLNRP